MDLGVSPRLLGVVAVDTDVVALVLLPRCLANKHLEAADGLPGFALCAAHVVGGLATGMDRQAALIIALGLRAPLLLKERKRASVEQWTGAGV